MGVAMNSRTSVTDIRPFRLEYLYPLMLEALQKNPAVAKH
jgi:hypothetical protein